MMGNLKPNCILIRSDDAVAILALQQICDSQVGVRVLAGHQSLTG